MCDDSWDLADATVACRQANFTGATQAHSYGRPYGQGIGPIWFSNLACDGTETNLEDCGSTLGEHNCGHYEDAGADCYCEYIVKSDLTSKASGMMSVVKYLWRVSSGECPQGGCPQGRCPQRGCPQGGCPQGGCPQGGCPQEGVLRRVSPGRVSPGRVSPEWLPNFDMFIAVFETLPS